MTVLSTYLPQVAWKAIVQTVIVLSDTTYRVTIQPYDVNDPGYGSIGVGLYLVDFLGHTYTITASDVGGDPNVIEISDDFEVGRGPLGYRESIIYESVDLGNSPYLAPVRYESLDKSAFGYRYPVDLEILWRNKGDNDELTGLVSHNVSVTFKNLYKQIPVGRDLTKVYRSYEEAPGKPVLEDVLFYNLDVTLTGFTLTIDSSEGLTGVFVEYHFKEKS